MRRFGERLRGERGEGLITGLIVLAGVLIPLLFVVPLYARLEQARLATEQTARDAVRAAVDAPDPGDAQQAANTATARGQQETGWPLTLTLTGVFARGATLTATATAQVDLASIPFFGAIGTVTVHGSASAPIDSYGSLTTP